MRKTFWAIGIVVLVLVLLAVFWAAFRSGKSEVAGNEKIYRNDTLGFSFNYPANYLLKEKELGNGERKHYQVLLLEDTPTARAYLQGGNQVPGEIPPSITVDAFQNNLDNLSLEEWVNNSSNSNYKLSIGAYSSTTVAGQPALTYTWDGLYRSESTLLSHRQNILMFTVSYLNPADALKKDFERLVSGLKLF